MINYFFFYCKYPIDWDPIELVFNKVCFCILKASIILKDYQYLMINYKCYNFHIIKITIRNDIQNIRWIKYSIILNIVDWILLWVDSSKGYAAYCMWNKIICNDAKRYKKERADRQESTRLFSQIRVKINKKIWFWVGSCLLDFNC